MNNREEIRIAVCDDDEGDRAVILGMLSEYTDINNYYVRIDNYSSGEEFLAADVSQYKLVIFDIFMGELNGIETAKKLIAEHEDCRIIFCSTSNAFAAESYDVDAMRYLNKPIAKDKFFGTLDRFFHIHTSMRTITVKQNRMDESIYIKAYI